MRSEIVSTGTELIHGLTVDTNSAWLAGRLSAMGMAAVRHVTVGDDAGAIAAAVTEAAERADVVIVSGGLGPTADDLTRQAVAMAAGTTLERDEEALEAIRAMFAQLGRTMPEANARQADRPVRAESIENPCGTAPGIRMTIGRARVFVLPGVPSELRAMFERSVEPELRSMAAAGESGESGGSVVVARAVRCFGKSEATIGERMADLMAGGRNPTVGITAEEGVIALRAIARGSTDAEAWALAERDVVEIRRRLGVIVFGEGEATLEQAVAGLLTERGRTVATAESCTGGLLGKRLTDVPGSSAYFLEGFVTYSNEAKIKRLGVPAAVLSEFGAVSAETARAMAAGCRAETGADFALSVTGIAGPGGGTADKPVGLVFVGLAAGEEVTVRRCLFGTHLSRGAIRTRSGHVALDMLRRMLLDG